MEERTTILIVDDDSAIRELLAQFLEEALSVRVVTAAGGDEGLKRARELLPAIVLLDLRMPGLDGFELCRQLKADAATARASVIALTALTGEANRQHAADVGCEGWIDKPFDLQELIATLEPYLDRRPT